MLLAWQADAQLAVGKPEAALASVAAGLEAVEKTGGAPLEAELYRLRVDSGGSVPALRPAASGASRPLPRAQATVSFPIT